MGKVELKVDFTQCQGLDPEDEIWWRIGHQYRRCGGVTMVSTVYDGKVFGNPIMCNLTQNGSVSGSVDLFLPKDPKSIRDLGETLLKFADKIEEEIKETGKEKHDSKDIKQRN